MNTKLCNKEKFSLNEARNLLKGHKKKQAVDSCMCAIKNEADQSKFIKL